MLLKYTDKCVICFQCSFSDEPKIKDCQNWSPTTGTSLNSYPNSYSLVGNPHPDISWRRKSSLGQLNASILLNTYDSDQYEIIASNELGNSTCILNITVECKCESSSALKPDVSCLWLSFCYQILKTFFHKNRPSKAELQWELRSKRENTLPMSLCS